MNRRELLLLGWSHGGERPSPRAAEGGCRGSGCFIPIRWEQWGGRAREGFHEGMRSLGWIEGKTLSIDYRFANGDPALLSANAADLAAEKVDLIVAFSGFAAQAARAGYVDDTDRHGYG